MKVKLGRATPRLSLCASDDMLWGDYYLLSHPYILALHENSHRINMLRWLFTFLLNVNLPHASKHAFVYLLVIQSPTCNLKFFHHSVYCFYTALLIYFLQNFQQLPFMMHTFQMNALHSPEYNSHLQ
jgi:hypothetical protein